MLAEFARTIRETTPALYWATAAHLIFLPILLILAATDNRIILGLNPWIKPMKFIISTAIYMITAAFLIRELGFPRHSGAIGVLIAVSMIVENSLISMQSFRGIRSHFNNDSLLDGIIFLVMGSFIIVNTLVMAWLLWVSFGAGGNLGAGYLWGIRLGIAVFLLGSAEAGFMLRLGAHTVGAPDGGPGIPFLNWSTHFGDLRIAHFIGLHALQILPLAGWLIDRWAVPNPVLAISVAAIVYTGTVTLLVLQALAGKPLFF